MNINLLMMESNKYIIDNFTTFTAHENANRNSHNKVIKVFFSPKQNKTLNINASIKSCNTENSDFFIDNHTQSSNFKTERRTSLIRRPISHKGRRVYSKLNNCHVLLSTNKGSKKNGNELTDCINRSLG